MYGDFEAQRHWMEITINLPLGDWYRHTPLNDLQYWGLDYPPLTAYVSWMFGQIALIFHPELVHLTQSRGHESITGKIFMRISVILADLIVYIPSVFTTIQSLILAVPEVYTGNPWMMLSVVLQPSLLLIDHGHFQYNGVCIGLALLAASAICGNHDILGSVLFCLSLNFKQMSLYYSLVFFCVLLRKIFQQSTTILKLYKLVSISGAVILTFALLWSPFCGMISESMTCVETLGQVLHRLFPFSRGIFEGNCITSTASIVTHDCLDKVANLWYALSVVYDYRGVVSSNVLTRLSIGLTLLMLAPTLTYLLRNDVNIEKMLLALMNSAVVFFLASFQVHEKSLLLSLVPAAFLAHRYPSFISWYQTLGTFTMFPLLIKDGLRLPYLAIGGLYLSLVNLGTAMKSNLSTESRLIDGLWILSAVGMTILHIAESFIAPPARLPDLYAALFSLFGTANLLFVWTWSVYQLHSRSR